MINLYLDLFYENFNVINQHYHKQIHLLSLIALIFLGIFVKKESKSSSMISLPIEISMLSIGLYIVQISSESLEEKRLTDIVN